MHTFFINAANLIIKESEISSQYLLAKPYDGGLESLLSIELEDNLVKTRLPKEGYVAFQGQVNNKKSNLKKANG
ncbi:hypothetical protein [Xanthocytophaga agilis]|uniref:Uncharacterized protein n=1 Tax=Xanthocytophaga agilis TaxID=3048010 RepID=A0AAE3RA97_9BACT|nr:hypothetical protein [Xanthocytophaga agilis]MDJ1503618.1 hypothetical protein [Xanthocytophaga agilis]